MFKKFRTFLEEKGPVGTPKVALVADYDGEKSDSPPAEKGKKGSAPYGPKNSFKTPKPETKGLADAGDQKLVYDVKSGEKKEIGHYPKGAKLETKLSPAKFVEKMHKIASLKTENTKLPKLSENPHPSEVINYLTESARMNSKVVENLVHDAKRSGLLYSILECALTIPETYSILVDLLKENKKATNKFTRVMEEVAPPVEFEDEDTDDFSDEDDNTDNHMNDDDMDSDDMNHSDDMGDGDMDGDMDHSDDMGDGDMDSDMGDDDDMDHSGDEHHDDMDDDNVIDPNKQMGPSPDMKSGKSRMDDKKFPPFHKKL